MHERISVPYPRGTDSEPEEQHPDSIAGEASARADRLTLEHGPESAIGAFLSLTRTRTISAAKDSILGRRSTNAPAGVEDSESAGGRPDQVTGPWSQYAGLGRGRGGGLSRGLRSQASDLTRKDNG
jgi:hypothetical protein